MKKHSKIRSVQFAGVLFTLIASNLCIQNSAAQNYDTTRRSISLIPPGTVVPQGAPQGWTHLIVKSFPRVASGDLKDVPQRDVNLASLLFTALVAKVERGRDGQFQLTDFATGVGTSIAGKDTIITSSTQKQLGAGLGLLARMVLKEFDAKQSEVVYRARGRQFLIVDTTGAFRLNNQNRMLPLRYAVHVHPQTGQLDTFCWLMNADTSGNSTTVASKMHWMPPSLVFSPQLYADSSQYNFVGIPSDTAFCSTNIPSARLALDVPADARKALALPQLNPSQVESLHRWFLQITSTMRNQFDNAAPRRSQPAGAQQMRTASQNGNTLQR